MINKIEKEFLWTQAYRPQTIRDCVLPKSTKTILEDFVKSGDLPNLLLTGTQGLGKTTVAKALCNELDFNVLQVNGSEETGIDVLRTKIRQYASTMSLKNNKPKIVLLDEADYLNPNSTQVALRGFMEEFSKNARFILTCNAKHKLIQPIHSRCTVIEFNYNKKDMVSLLNQFLTRLKLILNNENVTYEENVLAELLLKYAPDWRRVINECQKYSANGKSIDSGILVQISSTDIKDLMEFLKEKNFSKMRKWVIDNLSTDSIALFRKIYNEMYTYVQPISIPALILILADYQYKDAFVIDKEINTVAFLTQVMASIQFK